MLFVDILNCETSSLFRSGVAWGVKFIQGEGQIILSGGEFLKDETPPKKIYQKLHTTGYIIPKERLTNRGS
jgi:hypothetical protein